MSSNFYIVMPRHATADMSVLLTSAAVDVEVPFVFWY